MCVMKKMNLDSAPIIVFDCESYLVLGSFNSLLPLARGMADLIQSMVSFVSTVLRYETIMMFYFALFGMLVLDFATGATTATAASSITSPPSHTLKERAEGEPDVSKLLGWTQGIDGTCERSTPPASEYLESCSRAN